MAIGKALEFVNKFKSDRIFRRECNNCGSKDELLQKLDFNSYEFKNAISMSLVKCQTYAEADVIHEIKFWFAIL
ncbi:hypothetical protein OAA06_01755 [bacterium]|nr:hypothetical protein [bacterium]